MALESDRFPTRPIWGEDSTGKVHPVRTDTTGRVAIAEDEAARLTVPERTLAVLEELLIEARKTNELLLEIPDRL